jgi:hypothetical protein
MAVMLTCDQDKYIFPLLDTTFEGVPAKVPYRYQQMLESEYGKAAVSKTDYNGYVSRKLTCASLWLIRNQVPIRHTEDAMVPYELKVYVGKA